MIVKGFKNFFQLNKIAPSLFSTHHEPTPTKLPKVESILYNLF